MTSVTAGFPVGGAQGSKASLQDAPGRSYDDGMYHLGNARPVVVADPLSELSNAETKPIATADATPNLLAAQGWTEPGMLRGPTTDTTVDMEPAAVKPAVLPADPPLDLRKGHFDEPLRIVASMSTSTTASSSTTSSTSSFTSMISTTLHTTSIPTTTQAPSTTRVSHPTSTPASAATHAGTLTRGAQAGVVISVLSLAAILIGVIFWRLHRKKRALQMSIRGEKLPPPPEKPNPVYRFASNLYTSSTSTLVNVAEMFKASNRDKVPSINDGSSSIYSTNQTQSNLFTSYRAQLWKHRAHTAASRARLASSSTVHLIADKARSLRGKKPTPDRRSRCSHGYAFAQEFQHVPPPQPTRLQKIVTDLCANGSSTVRTVTARFKAQAQPQPKDNASSMWSTMSSRNPYSGDYDAHQFQPPPCNISDSLDLVKVRSVSSGTVAMSNPAEISVDALAGRISGEGEHPHQEAARESSPSPSQSTTAPSQTPRQRQSPPPPEFAREASPAESGRAPSHTQLEVPSVKLWTKQVYRVEMDFAPRSDGHLHVSDGQMVLLEQIFDDGWALCTLTETETQGLIPRACLSTWPIKERRQYASSSTASERTPSSATGASPTDSTSLRFYRQHSRPGTPKPGPESNPPSVKKQSISPSLSTVFRP
ncbi:uncharacterized protein CDV56_103547 [Aspergillus thermomutatus]|uniref:SH3 domain-containing protein n=1 Tax=Aspergillus thermomutatus TaxID=41047 RepID=A0A397GKS0_ASPTH|nr:uncharacterized protein CDV56_103547 [Aspergillus thermomutatus]RHZ48580.1 hypothetical protein CDV56_103547 [Aspergillus thermomutatus]